MPAINIVDSYFSLKAWSYFYFSSFFHFRYEISIKEYNFSLISFTICQSANCLKVVKSRTFGSVTIFEKKSKNCLSSHDYELGLAKLTIKKTSWEGKAQRIANLSFSELAVYEDIGERSKYLQKKRNQYRKMAIKCFNFQKDSCQNTSIGINGICFPYVQSYFDTIESNIDQKLDKIGTKIFVWT